MDESPDARMEPECGFIGNPEIYGIGIRLGFYTQALAAWFANYFIASEARVLRPANLLYILVLEIAMVIYAASPDEGWEESGVYAIEVFVMLTILFAIGFVAVSDSQPRYSRRYLAATPGYTSSFQLLAVLALVFGNWFWWHGMDLYKPTPCGTPVWVLVHVDLYGWLRKLGQAVNVYLLIWYGAEFLQSVPIVLKRLFIRGPKREFMNPGPQNSLYQRFRLKAAQSINGGPLDQELGIAMRNGTTAGPARAGSGKGFISRQREKLGKLVRGDCRWVDAPLSYLGEESKPCGEQVKAFENVRKAEDFLDQVLSPYLKLREDQLLATVVRETYLSFLSDIITVLRKLLENHRQPVQNQDQEAGSKEHQGSESKKIRDILRFNPFLEYLISVAAVLDMEKTPVTRDNSGTDVLGTIQLVHSVQQHARMRRVEILLLNNVTQRTLHETKPSVDGDLWKWVELASRVQYSRQLLKTQYGLMSPGTPRKPGKGFPYKSGQRVRNWWKVAAVGDIVILVLLIAQIETTLVWNQVQGINVIKSFGQLLGFFVGVCGLFTVVYRKTNDEIHNIRQATKKPEKTEFDKAVDVYLNWKKRQRQDRNQTIPHVSKTEPLPPRKPAVQPHPPADGRHDTLPSRPVASTSASAQNSPAHP